MYAPQQNPNMDFQSVHPNQTPMNGHPGAPCASFNQSNSTSHAILVTTQPNVMVVHQPFYKDYLGCSIANIIFCCLPLGIAALIYSCKTRDDISRGDIISAKNDSRTAFNLNMVALGLGLAVNLTWISYTIYWIVIYSSAVSSLPYNYYGF